MLAHSQMIAHATAGQRYPLPCEHRILRLNLCSQPRPKHCSAVRDRSGHHSHLQRRDKHRILPDANIGNRAFRPNTMVLEVRESAGALLLYVKPNALAEVQAMSKLDNSRNAGPDSVGNEIGVTRVNQRLGESVRTGSHRVLNLVSAPQVDAAVTRALGVCLDVILHGWIEATLQRRERHYRFERRAGEIKFTRGAVFLRLLGLNAIIIRRADVRDEQIGIERRPGCERQDVAAVDIHHHRSARGTRVHGQRLFCRALNGQVDG